MNRRSNRLACLLAIPLFTAAAAAFWEQSNTGRWPEDWPKELEPLRAQARTIDVASGTQENIYEIRFKDRAEFEKLWPVLLSVKTPGAPLRLYKVGPVEKGSDLAQLESNAAPLVRIYAPAYRGYVRADNGKDIPAFAPWPKHLYGPHGELPKYVIAEKDGTSIRWAPMTAANQSHGFHNRARVDIDLVIDGQVIDLYRINLPKDTPIEDHRTAP